MTTTLDPITRWVHVGHSSLRTAGEAAREATRAALAGPDAKLLIVFAPCAYDAAEIAAAVGDVAGDVPAIGCSTTGHIGPQRHPDRGVVVLALGGDFAVSTARAVDFNKRPREVGEEVVSALLPLPDRPHHVVIMFTDNLDGDQQDMIRGAYGVLGATIPMIGAVAGNGIKPSASWQIHNGHVLHDSVVAAALSSDNPIGVSVRHGWRFNGDPMIVTGAAGNQVYTLDDGPALNAFLDRHRAPAGIEGDPAAFAEFALSRPLAVARRGDIAVRHVLGADPATRSLRCAAAVPKGAAVWLAETDVGLTLAATEFACGEAVAALGDTPAQALLVFDCAGRRAVLERDGVEAEFAVMLRHAGTPSIAGFYGNGEIARVHGANGFHNQTIVACALG
jgi:hypothetical protein